MSVSKVEHHINVAKVATKSFEGQKPGTSGLRKKVKEFQKEHYL